MSASPEFYKPATAPAFSPPLLHATPAGASAAEDYYCRTPTAASGIAFLQEPDTCPPAPRKPRAAPPSACKKRLFDVVTLRLDDLERIFRPSTPCNKRRRSPVSKATARPAAVSAASTHDELISNPASSTSSSASFNSS